MVAVLVVPKVSWLLVALNVADVNDGVLEEVPSTMAPPLETMSFPLVSAVPLFVPPRAMGKIPVLIMDASNKGMSAGSKRRKEGAAGLPVPGPAHTVLAVCVAKLTVSVCALGELEEETLNTLMGIVSVTIPNALVDTVDVPGPGVMAIKEPAVNCVGTGADPVRPM